MPPDRRATEELAREFSRGVKQSPLAASLIRQ
jgi:hypothetical protein